MIFIHQFGFESPPVGFCGQVLGEHDDSAPTDELVETSTNQVLDKSPSAALHVQEAILKELTNEDVHKVHARTNTHTGWRGGV